LVENKQKQESEEESAEESQSDQNQEEKDIDFIDINQGIEETRDEFQKAVEVYIDSHRQFSGIARIDTGCPVSLIKACCVDGKFIKKAGGNWSRYHGINRSKLTVLGIINTNL